MRSDTTRQSHKNGRRQGRNRPNAARLQQDAERRPLSRGEVGFLWWFIQGSIMDSDVRWALRYGWGLCPRHTLAWLTVESAFRHARLHGPALLYDDLMRRAVQALELSGPWRTPRLARRLRATGPCHLCALGFGPASSGFVSNERLRTARDVNPFRLFMRECGAAWAPWVCGRCVDRDTPVRCRPHLIADIDRGADLDIAAHRALVETLSRQISRYHDSFIWERHGTDTVEDRAALVGAAGWCAGWRALLELASNRDTADMFEREPKGRAS